MSNTYTKQFQDGSALTEAQLNTAFTTLKPSLSNLSLSTTGSASFQILRSTGSNATPEYDDIGDILANGVMTANGANTVLENVTSVSSTQANLIGNALNSASAANNVLTNVDSNLASFNSEAANTIIEAADSNLASGAGNDIFNKVTSVNATQANLVGNALNSKTAANNILNTANIGTIQTSSFNGVINFNSIDSISITEAGTWLIFAVGHADLRDTFDNDRFTVICRATITDSGSNVLAEQEFTIDVEHGDNNNFIDGFAEGPFSLIAVKSFNSSDTITLESLGQLDVAIDFNGTITAVKIAP